MSVQIHCDNCDRSLDTRKPYAADNVSYTEPNWVRLFKDGHYGFDSGQGGWAFCDDYCVSQFFSNKWYRASRDRKEARDAAPEK